EGELAHILRGTGAGHLRWRSLVHNHAQNWSAELAELARREGYRLFALHRPVRDRLVSFHHWHRGKVAGGEPCIGGPAGDAADLDTFLRIFVSRPCYSVDWALPDWAGLIDHWYPATGEGIARCLSEMLAMEVEPVRHNASASRGWAAAVESGEVSPETAALVDGDARVRAWDRWEEGLGARSIRPAPDYQPSTIN
ncbi:MAG TPA: hypothetical protein PLD37_12145, partial [Usitatibacteraceae bacterium]|nr:hypothetical protein [Usitatibacteraceae bacterium]